MNYNANREDNGNIFITCGDCGSEFVFTKGEQEYFRKNVLVPPRRCPVCCAIRKSNAVMNKVDKMLGKEDGNVR